MTDATAQITSQQIDQLITALTRIADKQMTITTAADWPMLYALVGLVFAVLVIFFGVMWRSLSEKIDGIFVEAQRCRTECQRDMDKHEEESAEKFKAVWSALDKCQMRCCDK